MKILGSLLIIIGLIIISLLAFLIHLYLGMLVINAKPVKLFQIAWGYSPNGNSMELNSELFPEVQWSDDEPTKVKIIVKK